MDLSVLVDMIVAHSKCEEEEFDVQMNMLAWQTALLMNSTGNFKKKIKPKDLYIPLAEQKEQEKHKKQNEEFNPEERQKLQEELLQSFKDSQVIIQ